jgi:hypothetical protein
MFSLEELWEERSLVEVLLYSLVWYKSAHVLMKGQAYKRLKFTCLLQIAELVLLTYYSGGKQ